MDAHIIWNVIIALFLWSIIKAFISSILGVFFKYPKEPEKRKTFKEQIEKKKEQQR